MAGTHPTNNPAGRPMRGRLRAWLAAALLALVGLAGAVGLAGPAAAQGVNGLWSTTSGDYAVFLQDGGSGTSFALEVPGTFDTLRVWVGSGSATQLSLQNLANAADGLTVSVNGTQMSGTQALGGTSRPYSASLSLAWVSTAYTGVWQKAGAANAYLVFCVLNTGNGRLGVQIDVTVNADRSYHYDIFTGAITNDTFVGATLTGSGLASRLQFDGDQLSGSTSTVARPVQTTPFTATRYVAIRP